MTSGSRLPTWKERENNRRRERRRRAIAAKIYAGLRAYGNFKLPKHCDNNEVLKALCNDAGWIVEDDGLTYKKGMKPPERCPETGFAPSPFMSPVSSSYPSPASSACPSPVHSSCFGGENPCPNVSPSPNPNPSPNPTHNPTHNHTQPNVHTSPSPALVPWLKGLSAARLLKYGGVGGSYSAPVTPPLCSPTCRSPRGSMKDNMASRSSEWEAKSNLPPDPKDSTIIPADCAATALLNAWTSSNNKNNNNNNGQMLGGGRVMCPLSPRPQLRVATSTMEAEKSLITTTNTTTSASSYGCGHAITPTAASPPRSGMASPVSVSAAAISGGGGGVWMAPWATVAPASIGTSSGGGSPSFSSALWRPGYSYVSPASTCTAMEPKPETDTSRTQEDRNDMVIVKAWAGEHIHEEFPVTSQDLDLKL